MQPLIGLSVIPVEATSSTDHAAVQLTKSGDLFYQILRNKSNQERDSVARYVYQCQDTVSRTSPTNNNFANFASSSGSQGSALYGKCISRFGLRNSSCTTIDTNCVASEVRKKCKEWIDLAYEAYTMNPSTNESPKICSMAVKTDDGKISTAYDQQRRNFEMFSDSNSDVQPTANDMKAVISVEKESLNAVQENAFVSTQAQIEKDAFSGTNVVEQIEKEPFKGPTVNSFEISNTPRNGSAQKNTQTSSCPVCEFPVAIDSTTCSCCHVEVDIADRLRSAQDNRSVLTNNFLERECEVSSFELVKYPGKSRDPLSIVLFTNWNNDDDYTPINLSGKLLAQEGAKESAGNSRRKRKIKTEKVKNELDESDVGWFLNESGSLEVGQRDNFEKLKEEILEIGTASKERMTRSKTRQLRNNTRKVQSLRGGGEEKGRNCNERSKGILKTKDGQTEVKCVEILNSNDIDKRTSFDSDSAGKERITSSETSFDTQYRNVSKSSGRANRVVTVRKLFGSRETDLVAPVLNAELQYSSLMKGASEGVPAAVLKIRDAVKESIIQGSQRTSEIFESAKITPDAERSDSISFQPSENIGFLRDSEERLDRDPDRASVNKAVNVVAKEFKREFQRSAPVKRYSPLKSSNTPRKKKVGRVMGF